MKLLNGLNNMVIKVWAFLVCSSVTAFGADEFDAAASTIGKAGKTGASVLGTGLIWFFAVFLLWGSILGGMILGYKNTKKQAEQDQDSMKIYIMMGVYGVVGLFVFVIITSLVSLGILGDSTLLFKKIYEFYKTSLEAGLQNMGMSKGN